MRMSKSELAMQHPKLEPRYSVCDQTMFGNRPSDYDQSVWSSDEDSVTHDSFNSTKDTQIPYCGSFSLEERDKHLESTNSKYCLVASKQMVGIYLTVWVKSDLRDDVHNMKVSCVGRGLMGYLGNKLWIERRRGRVFNGWKEGIIYFPPTYKYSKILIDMQDMICILEKNEELLHDFDATILFLSEGVIVYCGMVMGSIKYLMFEGNQDFQIIDLLAVYSIFIAEVESINLIVALKEELMETRALHGAFWTRPMYEVQSSRSTKDHGFGKTFPASDRLYHHDIEVTKCRWYRIFTKGQKQSHKRQNRARERKEREEKVKIKAKSKSQPRQSQSQSQSRKRRIA
ncbi:type I inositol polyphosphate 5-phosphatase 4-like protein [Tanacetum coccineum]